MITILICLVWCATGFFIGRRYQSGKDVQVLQGLIDTLQEVSYERGKFDGINIATEALLGKSEQAERMDN